MRHLLDFDDAGAQDDHPAKGVTVGDIRAWFDAVQDVHSALDDALGDTDVTHIEDDDELRSEQPVQWAAQKLAELIR